MVSVSIALVLRTAQCEIAFGELVYELHSVRFCSEEDVFVSEQVMVSVHVV